MSFFFFFFNNLSVFFVFFFFLNIDVSWHLYCYTDTTNFTIFLIYIKSDYAAIVHCSCKSVTVLWFRESAFFFFFFLSNRFVFFFFLLNIDVSWHLYCYTDITNFTIFSQLLTCQFIISQNKIIKYETVINHNWK